MKSLAHAFVAVFVTVLAVSLAGDVAVAQNGNGGGRRGRFNPAQRRAMMEQFMKETLGVSDQDWKVIEPRIQKVVELERAARGMRGFGRHRPRRPGERGAAPDARRGRRGPGGFLTRMLAAESPEAQALAKVLESKTSTPDQIKAALKNFRAARDKQEKELEKARQNLREVLTLRQEGELVLMHILD